MGDPRYPFPGKLQNAAEYLYQQIYALRSLRRNFRRFDLVVQSKPHGVDGEFARWIQHMFTHTLCVAVRRLVDDHHDVVSLRKLMQEIRRCASEFSREKWTRAWMHDVPVAANIDDQPADQREFLVENSKRRWAAHSDRYFDKFAPDGKRALDPEVVTKDEQALDAACQQVEDMVNAYIAHDAKEKPHKLPTYGDLDAAVDLLVGLAEKYYSLFHQTVPDDSEDLDSWKNRPDFPFPERQE